MRLRVWTGLTLLAAALAAPLAAASPLDGLAAAGDLVSSQALVVGLGLGGVGAALGFFVIGGLRHVNSKNVLEHPMRRSMLEMIQTEPGIHLRELASRHGTAVTNTQWHLRKLEQANLVRTQKVQSRRLYYPVAGGLAARDDAMRHAALKNPNAVRLTKYLEAHGGVNQRSLAEALKMNPGTVRWHLRRLEATGVVRAVQEAHQTRYFLMARERSRMPSEAEMSIQVAKREA